MGFPKGRLVQRLPASQNGMESSLGKTQIQNSLRLDDKINDSQGQNNSTTPLEEFDLNYLT